ncbi:serine/threonine protein kinase [Dermatophilaceae bacterium Soc4.6]
MIPVAGLTLGSRYTLTERIAAGGMGEVWRARDSRLERVVAVKVMRPSAADEQEFVDRFRDEARHTAALSHPNIATVYDYGEDDGAAYLVMELVEGLPLSQLIARGPMSPDRVRSIMGQAALALAAAHAQGVVHRDVKPANILITPEGRVKLTDFGIASAGEGSTHTKTGEVLGTPHYLSPEQATGRTATGASDIYALGVVGYEMLVGRKPFDGTSAVVTALMQVNDPPPALPPSVPADLRLAVERCLEKDPQLRPASAAALASELGLAVGALADVDPATSVIPTGWTDPSGTAVIVAAPSPSGTTALPPPARATTPYDAPYDEPYDPDDGLAPATRRRDPQQETAPRSKAWLLWLIPVVVALAAIVFFVVQLTTTSSPTPSPTVTAPPTTVTSSSTSSPPTTSTTTTTTTTSSTSSTTTPLPTAAVIDAAAYVGKPVDSVIAALNKLGFTNVFTEQTPDGTAAGTVIDVQPRGNVLFGNKVTLTVSSGPPPSSDPTTAPTAPPSAAATISTSPTSPTSQTSPTSPTSNATRAKAADVTPNPGGPAAG